MPIQFSQEEEQQHKIQRIRMKEAEEDAQKIAEQTKLPYVNLAFKPVQHAALEIVPETEARNARLAVIAQKGDTLTVAVEKPDNPYTQKTIDDLRIRFHYLTVIVVSKYGLEKAWGAYLERTKKRIAGEIDISAETFDHFRNTITNIRKLKEATQEISTQRDVSIMLELVLASALTLRASDIHIEPEQNVIKLRIRIDGIMNDVADFDSHVYRLILSRIKLLSGMKLNIHNTAQDGRFSVAFEQTEIQVRSSVLPGEFGENIVMRLLDPNSLFSVEELGLNPDLLVVVNKQLEKPNGMIVVTGPTGSGKTTTLYAFLKKLQTPSVKIITIEDPIEYRLEGISQTQISPEKGYTFANGLRSILRQDPDVILVGEIRDLETVDIALQAALTGHLVFSTLHANDASGTIPRMMDIGATPNTIGPAINMIIAQRLLRKVCENCRKVINIKNEELQMLKEELKMSEKAVGDFTHFKKLLALLNSDLKIVEPVGCEECHHSGYKGRVGVYEIILVDAQLEKFLIDTNPSAIAIKEFSQGRGMTTLKQDGLLKVIERVTTIQEVIRVIG